MEDKIIEEFKGDEIKKRKEMISLLQEWEKTVEPEKGNLRFLYDGFFPGYYNKTIKKVLFIGREARNQPENDYIENTIKHFNENNLDETSFWERILCMFNIIMNNGIIEGKTSVEIWQSMKKDKIGFAAINISKYINDGNWPADKALINKFMTDSKLDNNDYIRKQIKILDPDIIITGNLWDYRVGIMSHLDNFFFKLDKPIQSIEYNKKCAAQLYEIKWNNKDIKLIDVYHFSSRKTDMNWYYAPISKISKLL